METQTDWSHAIGDDGHQEDDYLYQGDPVGEKRTSEINNIVLYTVKHKPNNIILD